MIARDVGRAGVFVLVGALASWTAACRVPDRDPAIDPRCRVEAGEGNRPYYAGSAPVRDEVDRLIGELAAARGEKVVEVGMRLVRKGEPAVPRLRQALADGDPALRANAAWLLGVMKDRRTIPDLERAATADADVTVRYEAAGALLGLGDPTGFPVLIDGLSERDARRRAKCIDVLAEHTRERFGFEPDGVPAEREAAIGRWRAWLAARALDVRPEPEAPAPSTTPAPRK